MVEHVPEKSMPNQSDPVVLELAPLPRDQIGPFLLLGLEKDADKSQVEANWAKRVIWARKNQVRIALEDINWAREALNDPERRVRFDVVSLNTDTLDGTVRTLAQRYGVGGQGALSAAWQPLDKEKDLSDYVPDIDVPDAEEVRAGIAAPEVPQEMPAVRRFLEMFVQAPLDPWAADLLK
jgi:hypothetical protein